MWGIDVHIHWLLPLFILFRTLPYLKMGWSPLVIVFSIFIEGMLFTIVLLHEFGHCWAARREGLPVYRILLWPFGGLAMIGGGTQRPETEFKVSIAGPLVNVALGMASILTLLALGQPVAPFRAAGSWIAFLLNRFLELNLIIFFFNLIPCFPMDGGRILRALLSRRIGSIRASIITAHVALVLATLMGLGGLFLTNSIMFPMLAFWLGFQAWQEKKMAEQNVSLGYAPQTVYWRGQRIDMGESPCREPVPQRGSSWIQRHRARSAMKRWLAENERQERIKSSVNDILDKMNRVGFDGLTRQEQQILRDASQLPQDIPPKA